MARLDSQRDYELRCVPFFDAAGRRPDADGAALLARCRRALLREYPFEARAIRRHFDGAELALRGRSAAETYAAAFKAWLAVMLPQQWLWEYDRAAPAADRVHVVAIARDQYEFLFDLGQERVVAVCGRSWWNGSRRDAEYMSEFLGVLTAERKLRQLVVGLTPEQAQQRRESLGKSWRERYFDRYGAKYDRGHFISLRQGGPYDINLFPQLAEVNQGRSRWAAYRRMENDCAKTPGTFCFSRPIYADDTWVPIAIEYGVVHAPDRFTVRRFPNRP